MHFQANPRLCFLLTTKIFYFLPLIRGLRIFTLKSSFALINYALSYIFELLVTVGS